MPFAVSRPPFESDSFARSLENLFGRALSERVFSGASLLVANAQAILLHRTWGHTQNQGRPVDSHTFFDLASLTKPLVTAPLCMAAISEGKLSLDTPLAQVFSGNLVTGPQRDIALRQLLSHASGLPAYYPFYRELIALEAAARKEALLRMILRTPLLAKPGTLACYSDLGFLLLSGMLEQVYQKTLDQLAAEYLFEPLQLDLAHHPRHDSIGHAGPRPPLPLALLTFRRLEVPRNPTASPRKAAAPGTIFAATEDCPWRKRLLIGEVHDENAYCLGGVAPHAGLFGTAHGVHRLLSFLFAVYAGENTHAVIPTEIVRRFWEDIPLVPGSTWRLGFDTPSTQGSSAGSHFSRHSIGHLGFTGTSFWFDLDRGLLIILLTNRVYPTRENERLRSFRPLIHDLVMGTYHDRARS